jgi:hypothetical protein
MTAAQAFLAAYPVGSIYWSVPAGNPAGAYAGTSWSELDSMIGGHLWQRTK